MSSFVTNPFELIMSELNEIKGKLDYLSSTEHQKTNIENLGGKPLRVPAAASYLGIAETTLYTLISKGKIKPLKPGKHVMFTKEMLDNYLNGITPIKEDPSTYLTRNKKGGTK